MQSMELEEPVPSDIARYEESLTQLFKEHKVNKDAHKAFFEALVEWKRTL